MTEAPAMLSTRDTLSSVLQSAVYDTAKLLTLLVVGMGSTLVAPLLQELTGTSLLGAMGWLLFGWVVFSFALVLAYGMWIKPRRADAAAKGKPLTGEVFVWRANISDRDFTSDRPYVDFTLTLFNASLVTVEVKAQEAGGYVKFVHPLGRRLEILADEVVESRHHGRLKARQWLAREDVLRQVEWLESPEGIQSYEAFTFPGLPAGPSFDFDFSEMRLQARAGDDECLVVFEAQSASYYLSQTALQKVKSLTDGAV